MAKDEGCANCGRERHPGSTLCEDCIIACGGKIETPKEDIGFIPQNNFLSLRNNLQYVIILYT